MKLTKENSVYIPNNLDLSRFKSNYRHGIAYLCHFLTIDRIKQGFTYGQHIKADEVGLFTNIHSQHLKNVMGDNYRKPIEAAIEAGIIEENPKYSHGNFTKSFRLTHEYYVEKTHKTVVGGRVRKYLQGKYPDKTQQEPLEPHQEQLVRWLEKVRLEIPEGYCIELPECDNPDIQRNLVEHSIDMIQDQDFWHTYKYGRFYSNVTNLSKMVRPFITINHKPLVGFDVSASHPLMVAWLVGQLQDFPDFNTFTTNISNLIPYVVDYVSKPLKTREKLNSDNLILIESVENGEFYPNLSRASGRPLKKTKKDSLTAINMNWHKHHYMIPVLRSEYPSIHALLNLFKDRDSNIHKLKSHLMTGLEGEVIINKICKRLYEEHPKMPLITIHDCILTTPEWLDVLKVTMEEEYNKIGLYPTLKETF